MDTKHSPEPWYIYLETFEDMIKACSALVQEDLRRAAECVNACHDIEDPDRAHAVARDAIRAAHEELVYVLEYDRDPHDRVQVERRLAHLSEAHALLGGGAL